MYNIVMKIISWNVNGIRAVHRKGLFVPFVEKYQPDILCLNETKAQEHQSEVDLPEYEEFWNSAKKKGYSGTAIFTKTKPLSVTFDIPEKIAKKFGLEEDKYGNPNEEGRVITAEYKNFYVVSVYTPNAKPDLSRLTLRHKHWDPAFLEYMKQLDRVKPVIFGGDLNVAHTPLDLTNPKQNEGDHGYTNEEREGIDKIIEAGFTDTFRLFEKDGGHYTWWSVWSNARARNVGWRIDYIFVSNRLVKKTKGSENARGIKSAKILPDVLGSDHCPVLIEI